MLSRLLDQAAKPVDLVVAARPTGIKRPDAHDVRDWDTETGSFRSWPQVTPVFGRAHSAHSVGGEAGIRSVRGQFSVQFWCNQCGKDGIYGLNGRSLVDPIERKDGNYPYKPCVQAPHRIRSQTLYPLSYGCVSRIIPDSEVKVNFRSLSMLEIIFETTGYSPRG
jgi:hypothetical protein